MYNIHNSYKIMLLKQEKKKTRRQYNIVSRSPYSFRKISNIKNYITGHNKQPKTYLKHIPLEPRNTNDCKEKLVFFVCRNTKTSAKIIVFKIANFEQFYSRSRTFHA